ncbi:hypothetical protein MalM25_08510 [Planctomycetes bacterium MalM25]|nr:hypothetical protein MalM25_08510 [Planctomycetes bacterium MalM25]
MKIGRMILVAGIGLAPATVLAGTSDVAGCFEGVLPPANTDTEIGQASWSTVCGGDCCDSTCCGDVGCCGSTCCGSTCCCDKNCGLFGQGILTHDPCGEGCALPELLLGCFCESEECFDDFISPITNPIFFEDPRNVTEVRFFFWQHKVPQAAGGGDINLYAAQIRARLTDRLSLIAAKDGYAVSTNALVDDGWADVDIGFKYGLYRDARKQRLLSVGVVYDMPVGSPRTLQAKGDGEFHLFLTGGAELCDCAHWISAFGGVIPVDGDESSDFLYWSNHFDYQVRKGWYVLTEFNWFHWTGGGSDELGLTGVEGFDAFNLGSGGVAGNDIVTGAIGMKYKPNRKTEIGIAWEAPLTERRDVIENRLTLDLILRY